MQNIGIFCSSSNQLEASFYEQAARLGEWMGSHGRTLIYGGANCGLMETLAKAVSAHGGWVVGVTPQILIDRGRVSQYLDEQVVTPDLNERKRLLMERSDILLALPGSLGTLDEVFTVMSANTIGIHSKRVVFWNMNGFWNGLFRLFDELLQTGVVNKPFDEVLLKVDTLEELVEVLG